VQHLAGARAAAEKLGYKVDELLLGPDELTEQRLDAVLLARNIHGVLIAPLPEASGHFTLDWSRLCAVAIEYTFSDPAFDRVVHDSYGGMRLIMDECRRRHIRRVGLLLSTVGHERTERLNGAAYWIEQKTGNFFGAVPPLFLPEWDAARFAAWQESHRIEAVVTSNDFLRHVERWCAEQPARGRPVRLANVNASPAERVSGIFQDPFNIGAAAARLLIEKIAHNERGIPHRRQTTLTPGRWIEGQTLALLD
jgi:DNA-binding LacI/PurR family transcriptional regulator